MGRKAVREKRARRKEYEFSPSVRFEIASRKGGLCEECGQVKASQFHHLIPIAVALMCGLNPEVIKSENNGKHVCHKCHQELDV